MAEEPTAAKIFDVEIDGKVRKFYLGFRAYKKLNINPFDVGSLSGFFKDLDIDKAVAVLEAGFENAARKLGLEDNAANADELLDHLDPLLFASIVNTIKEAAGDDGEPDKEEDQAEDPTKPQDGSPSGQSAAAG